MTLALAKVKAEEAAQMAASKGYEPIKLLAEAVALMSESLALHIAHIKAQVKTLEGQLQDH